jgi:hypothetical protein
MRTEASNFLVMSALYCLLQSDAEQRKSSRLKPSCLLVTVLILTQGGERIHRSRCTFSNRVTLSDDAPNGVQNSKLICQNREFGTFFYGKETKWRYPHSSRVHYAGLAPTYLPIIEDKAFI